MIIKYKLLKFPKIAQKFNSIISDLRFMTMKKVG